jgi:uncharacterized membrane protein
MEGAAMKQMQEPAKTASVSEKAGPVEIVISYLLRIGVTTSIVIVLVGLVLMFVHHPSYIHAGKDLQRLTSPGAAFPHTLDEVAAGLETHRGQAVVALGLIVLIGTPILRVAASIVIFAVERDPVYVLITGTVLVVLLTSFVLGRVE